MRRADRLLQIIQLLGRARRPVTAADIAQELEVTPRTVYQDVASLMTNGVPIRGEVSGHETLLAIDKARAMLGYAPQHSWRDYLPAPE